MTSQNQVLLTEEGLNALKQELNQLEKLKLPRAVSRVAIARDQGDITENSEYAAARDDLAFIEGRIDELKIIIYRAKIIKGGHSKKQIDIGCQVMLHIDGKKDIYTIVGEWEADPAKKKISHSSPLGKALLGKKVGEKVEVEAPAGKLVYQILHIQ